jgi:hypothetical protein
MPSASLNCVLCHMTSVRPKLSLALGALICIAGDSDFCRLCGLLRSTLPSRIAIYPGGGLTSVRREIGTVGHFDQAVSVNDCDDLAPSSNEAFPF